MSVSMQSGANPKQHHRRHHQHPFHPNLIHCSGAYQPTRPGAPSQAASHLLLAQSHISNKGRTITSI
jgi:hypothetical protein